MHNKGSITMLHFSWTVHCNQTVTCDEPPVALPGVRIQLKHKKIFQILVNTIRWIETITFHLNVGTLEWKSVGVAYREHCNIIYITFHENIRQQTLSKAIRFINLLIH